MPTLKEFYADKLEGSIDDLGLEALTDAVNVRGDPSPFSCPRPNRYAKWLLSSALQKSIRRGRLEDTRKYCDALLQIDPDYMFRRLNTVAAEDVGIANLLAMAAYAKGGNSKTIRANHGGVNVVGRALAIELAASPKCRLGDELKTLDYRELGDDAEAANHAISERSDKELLDVLVNRQASLYSRALALMYFTRFEPGERNALVVRSAPKANWRKQLLEVCNALGTPPLLRELCYVYAGRMMERQAYCLPLAWDLMKDTEWVTKDDPTLPESELVFNGVIAPAIDGHTSQGKKCLKRLVERDDLAKSLIPCTLGGEETMRAFHLTIFRTEGHLCAKRLTSPASLNVRQLSSAAVVTHYCHDSAGGERLLKYGPQLVDRLNAVRLGIMN